MTLPNHSRDYILIEGEGLVYWPMCPIKDCPNRICLRLVSKYCWPHTGSGKSLGEIVDTSIKEKDSA